MKQLQIILFLLMFSLLSTAQETGSSIDKQKIEAGRMKPDSNFVNYLIEKSVQYSSNANKTDSVELLLIEAGTVADKIKYIPGTWESKNELATYYFNKGELSRSLEMLLKAEEIAIASNDSAALFKTLRVVADLYLGIGDLNMCRLTLNRRQHILDNKSIRGLTDTSYYTISQYNSLAHYFNTRQVSRPDSVEYFYRKIYTVGKNTSFYSLWIQLGCGGLATLFSEKGEYDSAIHYYKIAIATALENNGISNYIANINSLAKTYGNSGQMDSAYFYAYKSYNTSFNYGFLSRLLNACTVLSQLYSGERKYDSAYKYLNLASQYKDSLSGGEKLKSIQSITNEQQLKELEKKREKEQAVQEYKTTLRTYFFIGGLLLLAGIIAFMYRVNKQRADAKREIETAYNNLKSTQSQLIQSEKMASLGELTAGIAHEIQNPLNFVNNFSEVNKELLAEMKEEIDKGNLEEVKVIAKDVIANEEKINHHGKRADAIVKGMLQHSRNSSGVKESTDINELCDEYLRLSYHGLRAKDKSFNATLKTDFESAIGRVNIIPQDIGRVVLNLITNAFYAVDEKRKSSITGTEKYEPTVSVSTKRKGNIIEISVADNGNGIPSKIVDKIFQPFFTTKPTGQGTGLGLSLSYDIVKAHGGELKVETLSAEAAAQAGKETGTRFIIELPG